MPQGLRRNHALHREQFFEDPKARPMGVGISLGALSKDGTELPVEISLTPISTISASAISSATRAARRWRSTSVG